MSKLFQSLFQSRLFRPLSLLLLSGCVVVPHTKINLAKGTFDSPKDDAFQGVKVSYQDASGVLTTAEFASASGQNNPAVIAAAAQGQTLITAAYFQGINDTIKTVGPLVLAGLGIPSPALLTGLLTSPSATNPQTGALYTQGVLDALKALGNMGPVVPVVVPSTNAPPK